MKQFEVALAAAERELAKKTKLRDKARTDLTTLEYEIPGLMNTINVLRQQLGKEPIPVSSSAVGLHSNISLPHELPANVKIPIEIPANFNAHEVGPGMGAIPSESTQPDGDFDVMDLPGMNEGGWV